MVAFSDREGNSIALHLANSVASIVGEGWKYAGWRYRDEDGFYQMLPIEHFEDRLPADLQEEIQHKRRLKGK